MNAVTILSILMITLLPVGAAFAQGRGADTLRELQAFDNFLDAHPAIDRDLWESPTLAGNPTYLAANPELRTFLQTHPGVREEIAKSPRFFVRRTEAFDRTNKDITLAEVRSFDAFLDTHPALEKDLERDPALIRDPRYLASHPELREYLNRHPAVAADLRESPRVFMWRERMLDGGLRGGPERGLARGNPPQRSAIPPRGAQPQLRGNPGRGPNPPVPAPRGNARGQRSTTR
jgi:phage-related protein